MLQKLHHVAYRCEDASATVGFYRDVIGLKFAHAIAQDRVPSTQAFNPHLHIFFELADGSYIAFFELAGSPSAERDPNTPAWVQHLALEVADATALAEGKRRLEAHGVEVIGPIDHGFCQSIYFFDPDGHRLEMTIRTESAGALDRFAAEAPVTLAAWEGRKRAGALAAPAG
jgi:glyoxylase I family protein